MEEERGYEPELWKKIAELGWLGLVIPEAYGGSALGYVDLVLVLEEMGRVGLPSPFISTVMLAEAINRAGSEAQKKALLPKIAAGELIATIASMEPSKVSMMPEGLMNSLKEDEIQDLVAFLLSRGDRNSKTFHQ